MGKQKFKTTMQKMGAWTIAITPIDVRKIFGKAGHVRVKGTIDGIPFNDTSLMPMSTGNHCIAIRAEIRKAINKKAGDQIEIILEEDHAELVVPEELTDAFEASPEAKQLFNAYSPSHKRNYTKYVSGSKNKETRIRRAVASVIKLEKEFFENGLPSRRKYNEKNKT